MPAVTTLAGIAPVVTSTSSYTMPIAFASFDGKIVPIFTNLVPLAAVVASVIVPLLPEVLLYKTA